MFESERSYCRTGLSQAIAVGDLEAATDWLSALQEFQPDTYGEHAVLEQVKAHIDAGVEGGQS